MQSVAVHSVVYDPISAHFSSCGYDRNMSVDYEYLPYSELGRIHKDIGNRPLKLGHFFRFGEFSLFH